MFTDIYCCCAYCLRNINLHCQHGIDLITPNNYVECFGLILRGDEDEFKEN